MAINHRTLPGLPAQQVIDWRFQSLPFDIPQRHIHGPDRGHGYGTASPVGTFVKVVPRVLDLGGISPDETRNDMILEIGTHRELPAVQRRVAQPEEA